jgi:hypothetical protein
MAVLTAATSDRAQEKTRATPVVAIVAVHHLACPPDLVRHKPDLQVVAAEVLVPSALLRPVEADKGQMR